MLEDTFDLKLILGELDYELTGTYTIELDTNLIEVNYDTIFVRIYANQDSCLVDAIPIINSMNGWPKIDSEVEKILLDEQTSKTFVNIDDIDEEVDILGDY